MGQANLQQQPQTSPSHTFSFANNYNLSIYIDIATNDLYPFHNITRLFGCVLWDHVLWEHDFPVILGFHVHGEHFGPCTVDFSTSNYKLSGIFKRRLFL